MTVIATEMDALIAARDALEEIALAGMSGTGQESEEAMTAWHARRAREFIGIAARALAPIKQALAATAPNSGAAPAEGFALVPVEHDVHVSWGSMELAAARALTDPGFSSLTREDIAKVNMTNVVRQIVKAAVSHRERWPDRWSFAIPAQQASAPELHRGWTRYEKARKLTPTQWADLHARNLRGETFDDMIDALPKPSTPIPVGASDAQKAIDGHRSSGS